MWNRGFQMQRLSEAKRWLLAACLLATTTSAVGTRIDLSPATTTTNVGSTFSVNVIVSGLSATAPALALTDFDLDIAYNPALLHASGVGFGTGLGSPPDVFGSDLSTAGVVDLFAVSFANYAGLRAAQGDTFTLATLSFLALAPGTDSLAFEQNAGFIVDLINADNQNPVNAADAGQCQRLSCIDVGGARVVIRPSTTVPEPGSLPLIAVAAMTCLALRRRTSRASVKTHLTRFDGRGLCTPDR